MYRTGKDYDEIAKTIIDVYQDYDINSLPLNLKDICNKLGVLLIPYSELDDENIEILLKRSKDAFYSPPTIKSKPQIYYNDLISSKGKIRYSIAHELKHYVCNDVDETNYGEDMAEYFGRYFLAPIPYLVAKRITSPIEIISHCGLSQEAASNAAKNVCNRMRVYDTRIFDYEKPLINLLIGEDYFIKGECH